MRTAFLVIALVATLGLGVASAQSADEAAINTRIEAAYDAFNKGDARAVAANYTEDAVFAVGPSVVVGRANIEKDRSEAYPAFDGLQATFLHHETRLLSPTTAIVHGAYEAPSATPPVEGHEIYTLVKRDDEWLIAALQTAAARAQ